MNSAAEKPLPSIKDALAVVDGFQLQAAIEILRIASRNRLPVKTRAGYIKLTRNEDGSSDIYWGDGRFPGFEVLGRVSEAHHAR